MSKVDEELTHRFHRAERPVGDDDLFEGLARRRRRRLTLQRMQAGALAVAVLAGTIGGFVALREVFDESGRIVGNPGRLPANGEIVLSRKSDDGRFHLFAVQPDGSGERQVTDDATNDTDPAVSLDGETVAYVHELDQGSRVIATVPIDGGTVSWMTPDTRFARDPAWSPDGTRIAYTASGIDSTWLEIVHVDDVGNGPRAISPDVYGGLVADPTWSNDGSRIAFAIRGGLLENTGRTESWDLATIAERGGDALPLIETERNEEAPAWSPDGTRIAFTRPGDEGDEIWTIAPDGSDETLLATAIEASLEPDLAWAPDGSSLLVSDGEWIYRVDATPQGDPASNFVQLVRGVSPSWQPIPPGSEPSFTASPEPSVSPNPEPEGVDVGLAFTLCESTRLGGIDFLGRGTNGYAWVGVPAKDDGTCPRFHGAGAYIVAADADGDRIAETFTELPWKCYVDCVPFDATDLDADGDEELIITSYFSIMDYYVMRYLGPPEEPSPVIVPVVVAEPGHPPAGLNPGEPLRIDAGGDEGYGSQIECEGYPGAPVIVWSSSSGVVESNRPKEIHIVRIQLQGDGFFHVVGASDYTIPADQPSGIESTSPACGVDWHPSA